MREVAKQAESPQTEIRMRMYEESEMSSRVEKNKTDHLG